MFDDAQPRATKDIDLLIKLDPDNARAVYAALASFGAPLQGLKAEDFIERGKFFRMGRAPVAAIDAQSGLTASFISREDLIAAKLAAGRPQDLAAVAALRQAPDEQES